MWYQTRSSCHPDSRAAMPVVMLPTASSLWGSRLAPPSASSPTPVSLFRRSSMSESPTEIRGTSSPSTINLLPRVCTSSLWRITLRERGRQANSLLSTKGAEMTGTVRIKAVLVLLLLLAGASTAHAQKVGSTSMQFLKVMPSARAAAMGEAYSVIATGAEAIHWNPAGLMSVEGHEFAATYVDWLLDTQQGSFAYAVSLGRRGAVGIQVQYVDFGYHRCRPRRRRRPRSRPDYFRDRAARIEIGRAHV